MTYPAPKPAVEPWVSLSTRLSPEVMEMLDSAIGRLGCTQRAAVEYAIRLAYGPQEDPEAARERHAAETKAAYQAAVAELFRLLELPADEKGPDHRALLMAANDACGTTRTAMLATWEGEETSWQR